MDVADGRRKQPRWDGGRRKHLWEPPRPSLLSPLSCTEPTAPAPFKMREDRWIEQLLTCQFLPENDLRILCHKVKNILMEESNVQPVSSPVTICGDIHGQFWDLLELLRKGGMVPGTSYIFMVSNAVRTDVELTWV